MYDDDFDPDTNRDTSVKHWVLLLAAAMATATAWYAYNPIDDADGPAPGVTAVVDSNDPMCRDAETWSYTYNYAAYRLAERGDHAGAAAALLRTVRCLRGAPVGHVVDWLCSDVRGWQYSKLHHEILRLHGSYWVGKDLLECSTNLKNMDKGDTP